MAAGMLTQVLLGYYDFQIGLYARTLFGLQLADYLLFALLALVVHALVNHKYVGHLVVVIAYAFMPSARRSGSSTTCSLRVRSWLDYSDMRGFDPFIGPWLWFKLYWAAWALLLARGGDAVLGARHGSGSRARGSRWRAAASRVEPPASPRRPRRSF